MPNHCYHHITFNTTLSSKQRQILKEIEKNERGICGYYMPMPEELTKTSSPSNIVSQEEYDKIMERIRIEKPKFIINPITIAMSDAFKLKYGYDNWYDWANCDSNWGTKWGCYDTDFFEDTLTCTTAWGPFSDTIFNMFIKDFPDVEWNWEEEQGFGATVLVEDGDVIAQDEYDPIPWTSVGAYNQGDWLIDVCYTSGRPGTMSTELVKPGFYMDYSEHEYIGDTLPMDIYNQLTEQQQTQVLKYYHDNENN